MTRRSIGTVLIGLSTLPREGLAEILRSANFHIFASGTDIDKLEAASLKSRRSPLLIVESSDDDPGFLVRQIKLFKASHPSGRVAVLGHNPQPEDMISAFRVGANAYLVNVLSCKAFIKALEVVMLGETILPSELLAFIDNTRAIPKPLASALSSVRAEDCLLQSGLAGAPLSKREKCILRFIADGASNKLIARKINIAEATVKVHVKAILRKIGVQNRTQAAVWAFNNALIISSGGNDATPSSAPMSAVGQDDGTPPPMGWPTGSR